MLHTTISSYISCISSILLINRLLRPLGIQTTYQPASRKAVLTRSWSSDCWRERPSTKQNGALSQVFGYTWSRIRGHRKLRRIYLPSSRSLAINYSRIIRIRCKDVTYFRKNLHNSYLTSNTCNAPVTIYLTAFLTTPLENDDVTMTISDL